MNRSLLVRVLPVLALGAAVSAGCPKPAPPPATPAPEAASQDAAAPEEVVVEAAPAPRSVDVEPDEPAPLPDHRFDPGPTPGPRPGGTAPAILAVRPPDADPSGFAARVRGGPGGGEARSAEQPPGADDRAPPPDIGDANREVLRDRFGCETVAQLQWPASWLSPADVVLLCCRRVQDGAPAHADAFERGCMVRQACSLLVDEGIGEVTEVRTVMELRRRVAPVRDPRTALAFLAATVPDLLPWFGDSDEERRYVLEGAWRYATDAIEGTRSAELPGARGGYEVRTFVRRGCGCRRDVEQVVFEVSDLAGVTERSRRTVLEDASGVCVD